MENGYWKRVEKADGWDTHKDKYEWVKETGEKDRLGNKKTVDTGKYSYGKPRPYGR